MASQDVIRAVVGLGNPGPGYTGTRHNVGFMVLDELARRTGAHLKAKFSGRFAQVATPDGELLLLAPQTWMNLSGDSVQPMCAFYRVAATELLVVHDEVDLPFGELRLKDGGGLAGHNGLKSVAGRMASRDFRRLRVGVGRPEHGNMSDHVLSRFSGEQKAQLPLLVDRAADAVERVLREGMLAAMNEIHGKRVI